MKNFVFSMGSKRSIVIVRATEDSGAPATAVKSIGLVFAGYISAKCPSASGGRVTAGVGEVADTLRERERKREKGRERDFWAGKGEVMGGG